MSVARIQDSDFAGSDPELSLLVARLGLDAGAVAYLEDLRWPSGIECPRCASDRIGLLELRKKHYCRTCGYQFRVTASTVLHNSHLGPAGWLLAVKLILESERGFPATRLQAALGVTYKTAWFVGHRIRAAMTLSLLDPHLPLALARDSGKPGAVLLGPASADGEHAEASHRWSLLRQLIAGDYHRPSPGHLAAYWNESCWRSAHPRGPEAFRETVRALLEAEPLTYEQLVGR